MPIGRLPNMGNGRNRIPFCNLRLDSDVFFTTQIAHLVDYFKAGIDSLIVHAGEIHKVRVALGFQGSHLLGNRILRYDPG